LHGPAVDPPAGDPGANGADGSAPAAEASTAGPESGAPASVTDATSDAPAAEQTLFDGVLTSDWKMSTIQNQPGHDDPGHFQVEDGALVAYPGTDLGLLWYTRPTPNDFVLDLEFRLDAPDNNSGVFVRFPDLDSKGYDNTAWVAINFGFEIQIDERGMPDGAPDHTTGAVYNEPNQNFTRVVANPPGSWNTFEIQVQGQTYTVHLNGQQVTQYVNAEAGRGNPSPAYVGLQTHTGHVAFRNIRMRAL
jgi:hypothetical protein